VELSRLNTNFSSVLSPLSVYLAIYRPKLTIPIAIEIHAIYL